MPVATKISAIDIVPIIYGVKPQESLTSKSAGSHLSRLNQLGKPALIPQDDSDQPRSVASVS